MNVKLTLSFDGTLFSGFQIQEDKRTVQGELERALKELTKEDIKVIGCGRTDAGVHAKRMCVNFMTGSTIPAEKFAYALNVILPIDVKCIDSQKVDDGFNARKSAKKKTYVYSVYESRIEQPLLERYSTKILPFVDVKKMDKASKLLIGEHDFKAFSSTGSSVKTSVRTIYDFTVKRAGERIEFTVTGNGFLYNMVRIMVGTLLDIGYNVKTELDIERALESGDRKTAGKTVLAKGLTLKSVEY